MHIPDAVLSFPVAAATGVLGAAGAALVSVRLQDRLRDRTTALMGMMAAFVFAAQMVNFPVFPGVSGHLMGGTLAAVVLGPWAGAGVIGAVLVVQCLLFADGGLTALGANFLNMGLIGAVLGYAIHAPIRRAIGGRSGVIVGGMAAAWASVLLSAGAFAAELAASGRPGGFLPVLQWMTFVHALIGLGEAAITGLVLRAILSTRPDLIDGLDGPSEARPVRLAQVTLTGMAAALVVASFLAPFASRSPDGLEYVGRSLGFLPVEAPDPPGPTAPMADYSLPGLQGLPAVTALVGAVGTLVVFALAVGFSRSLTRRNPRPPRASLATGTGPDAA